VYDQNVFLPFQYGKVVAKQVGTLNYVRALSAGYVINASTVKYSAATLARTGNANDEFENAPDAYIGIGFPISMDGSTLNYYGWIRVAINNAAGTFLVKEFAYNNVLEQPIKAGDRGAAGDYNADGRVDALDYTVWRNNLGTNFNLAGNGDDT